MAGPWRNGSACLEKLKTTIDDLDIPPEVLSSLPTMDQIQEKAAQARRRAQEALAQATSHSNP